MKNRRSDERLDILAIRERDTGGWWGSEQCNETPTVLVYNNDSRQTKIPDCAIESHIAHPKIIFPGCTDVATETAKWGASSGTVVLNTLQQDRRVEKIDVFGMNWNHQDNSHLPTEGNIVRRCANKAVIHETRSKSYSPENFHVRLLRKLECFLKFGRCE